MLFERLPSLPDVYPSDGQFAIHGRSLLWLWRDGHKSSCIDLEHVSLGWEPLGAEPFAYKRRAPIVATTPSGELLLWGGAEKKYVHSREERFKGDGVLRATDGTIRVMGTRKKPSARASAAWAVTESELLVWGGTNGKPLGNGAAYRFATDDWRPISADGAPAPRYGAESVWNGRELFVWGGADFQGASLRGSFLQDGAAYDPVTDRWRAVASLPGPKHALGCARATVRLDDGVLLVRRTHTQGADVDTLAVWRYDPVADLFEPRAAPPEVRGPHAPALLACGGRIWLLFGPALFEYLPGTDAWIRLPDVPDLFQAEPICAFPRLVLASASRGVYVAELGDAPSPIRAPEPEDSSEAEALGDDDESSLVSPPPPLLEGEAAAPVTAVALGQAYGAVGHSNGEVRLWRRTNSGVDELPIELRAADGKRVTGLAIFDDEVLVLHGEALEHRGLDGALRASTRVGGHILATRGAHVVVAGEALVAFEREEGALVERARAAIPPDETVSSVAFSGPGHHVAVVRTPRSLPRKVKSGSDTFEILDFSTFSVVAKGTTGFELGSGAAVPLDKAGPQRSGTVVLGGAGTYDLKITSTGTAKKATTKGKKGKGTVREPRVATETAWTSPVLVSADERWLAMIDAADGVTMTAIPESFEEEEVGRSELRLKLHDDEDESIAGLAPVPAFLAPSEVPDFVEKARWGGTVSAVALDDRGDAVLLGTPRGPALLVDRATTRVVRLDPRGRRSYPHFASEVVLRDKPLALGVDPLRGRMDLVLADGRYAALDVGTGRLSVGIALDPTKLAPFVTSDARWQCATAFRTGEHLTVGRTASGSFSLATGELLARGEAVPLEDGGGLVSLDEPEDEDEGPAELVTYDPVRLVEIARLRLPGRIASPTLTWLGGERWFVELYPPCDDHEGLVEAVPFVVDLARGVSTRMNGESATRTLDGAHFAVAHGAGGARRWTIHGEAGPLERVQSGVPFDAVSRLPGPGRRALAWTSRELALFDDAGKLYGPCGGVGGVLTALCASSDGQWLATWDREVLRRWRLG